MENKSKTAEFSHESDAHVFNCEGMLYQNFERSNSTVNVQHTKASLIISGTLLDGNNPNFVTGGYCITIMRGRTFPPPLLNFWNRNSWLSSPTHHTATTLHPWISGYFCSWKKSCVGIVSSRVERLHRLFMPQCGALQQTNSGTCSSWNGMRECRNVLPQAAITSKRANEAAWRVIVMKICNSFCTFLYLQLNISRWFSVYLLSHTVSRLRFKGSGSGNALSIRNGMNFHMASVSIR